MVIDVKLLGCMVRIYLDAISVRASINRDLKVASLNEDDRVIFNNVDCDCWDELIIKKD